MHYRTVNGIENIGSGRFKLGCPRPGIGQKSRTFCNVAQFFRLMAYIGGISKGFQEHLKNF